jgi:peptidyl-prolyl cis-trans isomerase A (cyclophilin A)
MKRFWHTLAGAALVAGATGLACAQGAGHGPRVLLKTSAGDITLEMSANPRVKATVENFVSYVGKGQYNGTVFHRVIPGFMIQGGGYTAELAQKPTGAPIQLESQSGLSNVPGTIAMARTSDPNSASTQFFINTADNSSKLDYPRPDGYGYAVFGKVVSGMNVVRKIESVPTGSKGPMDDVPLTPVIIRSASVIAR